MKKQKVNKCYPKCNEINELMNKRRNKGQYLKKSKKYLTKKQFYGKI